jgi:glycosyltransferase involved in cell wall biosynthesis
MKIAFLLTQSLESPSGLGRYGPLGRALARMGHQVEIFALHPDLGSLSQRRFEQEGVLVEYVAPMHVRKSGSGKSYYPAYRLVPLAAGATMSLARAALASQAEVIHIAKPHPMNSLAGLAGKYRRRVRLFLDCDDYEAGSGRFSGSWQKAGVAWFEKWTPRQVELVTTNTHFMRQMLADWGVASDQIYYLPNGVELARFAPPAANRVDELRARYRLEGKQVIAFIGSLSLTSHPVDLLLEAFVLLSSRLPRAVLLLVGGGEDLESLQRQVDSLGLASKVRFCGRVPPEEVVYYYYLAHVSVDPVHDNPAARGRSPLKLFESWACGVPFVTADVGDRKQLLGSPPAGLLARPGDASSLAAFIERALAEPELGENLQERGLARVQEYTWDRLAEGLEACYHAQGPR